MAGKPQTLSEGQKKQVTKLLWKQILAVSLVVFALLGGITGYSLWEIHNRLEQKLETLVANQFEESRIKKVVSDVARARAEALLLAQIMPAVENFKKDVAVQLGEIEAKVALIEKLESESDANAKEIKKALSYAQESQKEIEKFRSSISGLQSDLVKINRGIVEIQYFTYLSRGRFGKNPYQERIEQKMNELLKIAVPDPQERSKFVNELNAYRPDEE